MKEEEEKEFQERTELSFLNTPEGLGIYVSALESDDLPFLPTLLDLSTQFPGSLIIEVKLRSSSKSTVMDQEEISGSFIPSLFKPPSLLPIARHRESLLYTVENFQVTIIVGQTGSGKTTQIPQFLHQAGWCSDGKAIAVTQVPPSDSWTSVKCCNLLDL